MGENKKDAKTAWEEFVALPDLRQRIKIAGQQLVIEEQQARLDKFEDEIVRRDEQHERDLDLVAKTASARAAEPPKPTGGKTIMEVWEAFKAVQIAKGAQGDMRGGWKNPERVSVEQLPHVRSFVEFIGGDRPIAEVTAKQVIGFREYVMTTSDIGSSGVRKQRLNRSGAVFKYAASVLDIDDDFAAYFKFTGQIKKNPYQKFDRDDLVALFESETYRECRFETSSEYWLPLLGLFTGARLNELCQLLKSDIGRHEGVDTILIIDGEENKRLKTDISRRIVPIHSKLIELGFLEFVRSASHGRIFPHLREDPLKPGDYGQRATEDFTAYRRSVGVGNQAGEGKSRKAFHSFRSTFIDAMRKAKPPVPKDRRTRLVGHEYDDTHDDTYNGGDALTMFSIDALKGDVESVRFDVRFTPYREA
ncbi:MAG: site-specific integrase [Propionivibrio sp.]